ncbi:MAG: hypothetical protein HYZ27_09680 [Deltaproteobacteria bacterium]|nr:hypothetical protein [Deltaproteobacteria bacterium]
MRIITESADLGLSIALMAAIGSGCGEEKLAQADRCLNDSEKAVEGVCGCGVPDIDTDGDGALDCLDACPDDAAKTAPGECGCGVSDADSDGDGEPDCTDLCPLDGSKLAPGQCGCGVAEGGCPPLGCVPDGAIDDTLGVTHCCSGIAVAGSTYCAIESDWGSTWATCGQICGSGSVSSITSCIPSGRIDDVLDRTVCCSGSTLSNSTYCVNPADAGTTWTSCLMLCE